MKKALIILVVLAAAGFGYWTISPFFIDKRVSEEFPQTATTTDTVLDQAATGAPVAMQPEVVARGSFTGFDRVHYGSGDATLVKTADGYVIRFEDNFNVANGPDLFVGLGKDGEYREEAQLAPLKGNIGSQNYLIPDTIDIEAYNEVWIWCRAFSVPFAKATFE